MRAESVQPPSSLPVPGAAAHAADDGELVGRCLDGDDAAWHELIGRYARLVEAVIRRYHLPAEEAADAFQDVWVALWRSLASVRSQERLGPWLVTTAGRTAWDARKRLARRHESQQPDGALDIMVDPAADPEHDAIERETSLRVRAAFATLSPRCRKLLKALFFDETVSYAEIAQELGCSANSIGPIRGRCFRELRDALADR
ncbi:MAG: sigma-70 family RNA polymerase sigma factor [Chloroflexi bacterium]|nr:sigma-70 family RNA polymerase sigma factor [Chloroflexota bacterium]